MTHKPDPGVARGAPTLHVVASPRHSLPTHDSSLAESIVLAAVLNDASVGVALDWLRPEHFFLQVHAHVWAAIGRVLARHTVVPAAACLADVAAELRAMAPDPTRPERNRLAEVGGIPALTNLFSAEASVLDLRPHAERIHACWRQRQIETVTAKISAHARHGVDGPDHLLDQLQAELTSLQAQQRVGDEPVANLGAAARAACDAIVARARGTAAAGERTSTGMATLDRLAGGGFAPGELWILGGRPGLGKTSLALNVATNLAFEGLGVVIFSLEMRRDEIGARILASESGVSVEQARTDDELASLQRAAEAVARLPVHIDDDPSTTIEAIEARAKRAAARLAAQGTPLRLIVVDYLQIVGAASVPGRSRRDEIRDISRRLKVLARDLGVAVLALAQLNRAGEQEQRRPRATDLAECDALARDADWVGILWRSKDASPWLTDLAICKQRRGAAEADVRLGWQGDITRFSDHGGAK